MIAASDATGFGSATIENGVSVSRGHAVPAVQVEAVGILPRFTSLLADVSGIQDAAERFQGASQPASRRPSRPRRHSASWFQLGTSWLTTSLSRSDEPASEHVERFPERRSEGSAFQVQLKPRIWRMRRLAAGFAPAIGRARCRRRVRGLDIAFAFWQIFLRWQRIVEPQSIGSSTRSPIPHGAR